MNVFVIILKLLNFIRKICIFNKFSSVLKTDDSFKNISDYILNKNLIESIFEKKIKLYNLADIDTNQSYYINYLNQKKITMRKKYVINMFNIKRKLLFSLNYGK